MLPAVFVIDDFLADPSAFRERALGFDYRMKGLYPGRNSVEHVHLQGLEKIAGSYLREPLRAPRRAESHGHFRLTLADDPAEARVHIDPSHWSGILYLTRPEHCQGGTDFFRHRASNTDRVPRSLEELKAAGFESYDDLKATLAADSSDRSKWEKTMSVPMRFNRLVLLQPHYWHTAGPGFGKSVDDGRLVYLMFFWLAGQ